MQSCGLILGLIFLVITDLAVIISFATPYWLVMTLTYTVVHNFGLWARCGQEDCHWIFDDKRTAQLSDEDWFHATQGLMAVGLALAIIALIVATLALCCQCKNCNSAAIVAGLLVFCFLSVGIAVAVFGVKASKKYDAQTENGLTTVYVFGWSFWLAAASAGMALITSFIYCCSSRQTM